MDDDVLLQLVMLMSVAVVWSGLVSWLWWHLRLSGKLLPPQRERAVPWGGLEVLAAVIVYFAAVLPVAMFFTLSRFFEFYYGSRLQAEPLGLERRGLLWIPVFALPLQVGGIILLLKATCNVQLYQLGLTRQHCSRNALLGFLSWLGTVPVVYALLATLITLYQSWNQLPEQHAFEQLARGGLTATEWALLALAAVVAAPITEELLFRGVLQRYLLKRWWGGDAALGGAFVLALLPRWQALQEAVSARDFDQVMQEAQPVVYVLVMLGVYLVVPRRWSSRTLRTIYGVALLFAAAHGNWPSPVPLFLLGLVLGWLAQRTQTLVAPIVLHMLFNSVGIVLLLFSQSDDAVKGKAETVPLARPAAVSTSSLVPGS